MNSMILLFSLIMLDIIQLKNIFWTKMGESVMDYLKEYINGLLLLILSLVLLSYFVSTIFRYSFTGIEVKKSNSIYYTTYIYENTLTAKTEYR